MQLVGSPRYGAAVWYITMLRTAAKSVDVEHMPRDTAEAPLYNFTCEDVGEEAIAEAKPLTAPEGLAQLTMRSLFATDEDIVDELIPEDQHRALAARVAQQEAEEARRRDEQERAARWAAWEVQRAADQQDQDGHSGVRELEDAQRSAWGLSHGSCKRLPRDFPTDAAAAMATECHQHRADTAA